MHHKAVMIAGNPHVGRKITVAAVTLLLMLLLITIILAGRKRTAPVKEPPLHQPSATPR